MTKDARREPTAHVINVTPHVHHLIVDGCPVMNRHTDFMEAAITAFNRLPKTEREAMVGEALQASIVRHAQRFPKR